nr:diguanylate cyclase [uncultured Holophaga sp.]
MSLTPDPAHQPDAPASAAAEQHLPSTCAGHPVTRELLASLADLSRELGSDGTSADRMQASQLMDLTQRQNNEVFLRRLVHLAEAGLLVEERRMVVSAEILDEVRSAFLHQELARQRRLDIHIEPSHPFLTDPSVLSSALIFMVKSAEALAPEGSPLRLWMERSGKLRHFHLRFQDPGAGLQSCPFLASARLLAENCLGGGFAIEHSPGGTASLILTLPDNSPALRHETSVDALNRNLQPPKPSSERCTILAADDSRTIRHLIRTILVREHEVILASDGIEALRLAREATPDLILLDVIMPGLNGFEVCRALKEDPATKEIPVLFLTALSGDTDEALALAGGASDFIIKPISPPVLAARVRHHLELKRSREHLKALTLLDGLTGIANRRRYDEQLQQEWLRCGRSGNPLSLVMGDVDYFKCFNDGYGHLMGDDCLRQVARAMADSLHRPGDLAARYGGEEFVCILPETDLEGARQVAGAIRRAVEGLRMPHSFSPVAGHVTISLGVATAWPSEISRIEDLTRQADLNMYEAKRRGRNRVVS